MQTFRSNVTRLRTLIHERLSKHLGDDSGNLYGYQGITIDLLLSTCDEIHSLSQEIERQDTAPNFEIITLKRLGQDAYRKMKKFLEETAGTDGARDAFDSFVNQLSKLYEKTKVVYFIVTKNGIRDELELQAIRAQLEDLKKLHEELKALVPETTELHEEIQGQTQETGERVAAMLQELEDAKKSGKATAGALEGWHSEASGWHSEISDAHDEVATWKGTIKQHLELVAEQREKADAQVEDLEGQLGKTEKLRAHLEQLDATANDLVAFCQKVEKEVNEKMGDMNRLSMAGSFEQERGNLVWTQRIWMGAFVVGIGAMVGMAAYVYAHDGGAAVLGWKQAVQRIMLLSPLVWFSWFAGLQYSRCNRVREDYAFKTASAKAYEGYVSAARSADPSLAKELLRQSIATMGENPVRLYGDHNREHVTPFTDALERIGRMLGGNLKGQFRGKTPAGEYELKFVPNDPEENSKEANKREQAKD